MTQTGPARLSGAVSRLGVVLALMAGAPATLTGGEVRISSGLDEGQLEIRTHPVTAEHNWGGEYRFVLSVLGMASRDSFLPLLAIALEPSEGGSDRWLAVWNLGSDGPGWRGHLRALVPAPWAPAGARPRDREVRPFSDEDFSRPDFTALDRASGSRRRLGEAAARLIARLAGLMDPLRFGLHSYTRFRSDLDDRRFHQLYTKVRLYDDVSRLAPSPDHLSFTGLNHLLYHLLINRKPLGFVMDDEPIYAAVASFEGARRTHMGQVASHLQAQANLYHLGYEEVRYGLAGRPPVSYAAVLYLREADLPDVLPIWPAANPFDLAYSPYSHPEIRRLARERPEEKLPLAFYVLPSDFNLKPVIVADFFHPRNASSREVTGALRIGLDQSLAVYRIPIVYRLLSRVGAYVMRRTDASHFSNRATSAGIEPARIFGRVETYVSEDEAGHRLLAALEQRVANPLAGSFQRESAVADLQYRRLLVGRDLSRALRRLHEDDVRAHLGLGDRAVFQEDYHAFLEERVYREARQAVRRFNGAEHLNPYDWDVVLNAWREVEIRDPDRAGRESQQFLERLERLFPGPCPRPTFPTYRES